MQKPIREYDGKKMMARHLPPGMFAGNAAQVSRRRRGRVGRTRLITRGSPVPWLFRHPACTA
eukprot:scaffold19802_cov112-Isochrysis_galbana.AAC.1